MDSFSPPAVITAIADPEFESMVSGALFSQGWNVVARPLDLRQVAPLDQSQSFLDSLMTTVSLKSFV